jgi:hypothetical protein
LITPMTLFLTISGTASFHYSSFLSSVQIINESGALDVPR